MKRHDMIDMADSYAESGWDDARDNLSHLNFFNIFASDRQVVIMMAGIFKRLTEIHTLISQRVPPKIKSKLAFPPMNRGDSKAFEGLVLSSSLSVRAKRIAMRLGCFDRLTENILDLQSNCGPVTQQELLDWKNNNSHLLTKVTEDEAMPSALGYCLSPDAMNESSKGTRA